MDCGLNKRQAWWAAEQGLAGRLSEQSPSAILEMSGWARSVGGVTPYLAIFSRSQTSKAQIENSARSLEIYELPSARGCTYVVPRSDYSLALRLGRGKAEDPDLGSVAKSLGVTLDEIEKLESQVVKVLERTAMDPSEMKLNLGESVRNLGELGKKKGLTTTLPLALGRLQSRGIIRRKPIDGRLDTQRYQYVLWTELPLPTASLEYLDALGQIAKKFFAWAGPATLAQFIWFTGCTAKDAATAISPLGLKSTPDDETRFVLPDRFDDYCGFSPSREPDYRLIGSIDNLMHLRREVRPLLLDDDLLQTHSTDKGPVPVGTVLEMNHHVIIDRGRIVGLWDYDPESASIVTRTFVPNSSDLTIAIKKTEQFVRDELGDARSFSLDGLETRRRRIQHLLTA